MLKSLGNVPKVPARPTWKSNCRWLPTRAVLMAEARTHKATSTTLPIMLLREFFHVTIHNETSSKIAEIAVRNHGAGRTPKT